MRLTDLLKTLVFELQRHGVRDVVLIVDGKALASLRETLVYEADAQALRWMPAADWRPDAAIRLATPCGEMIITAPDRVIGRFMKPPKKRGKCEHGIPADYCTPCEVGE